MGLINVKNLKDKKKLMWSGEARIIEGISSLVKPEFRTV